MDLDQLKLILDTIQTMGGDAKEFGIWYIVGHVVTSIVPAALLFVFGVIAVLSIKAGALAAIRSSNASWAIADQLGLEVRGVWGGSDTQRLKSTVRDLQARAEKTSR